MSGPSAIANPMSAKIAVSSSTTWLMGWMRPISAGGSRTGRVTSTVSVLSRCSSASPRSASLRAAIAALTCSLRLLMSGPCSLRASGVIVPSVFNSADTEPLRPSAATRTASSAASSLAAATAARSSVSSARRSVIGPAPLRQRSVLGSSALTSARLRRDPLILHACPPTPLGIDVVDKHQRGPLYKAFALLHRRALGRSLGRQERQIGIAGFAAGLCQHAMHLAAMMRLVVEHMRDQKPCRLAQFPLGRAGVIGELACERRGVEPVRPVDHDRVERLALALELVPVAIERHGFGNAAVGAGRAGKAAHPDAVGPEQVIECGVDRAEASPFGVGERVGGAIQVLVLPAVIAGHALHIVDIDHRLVRRTDGGGQKATSSPSPSFVLSCLRSIAA